MAATVLIPVEEYLHSVYHPDRDYVEGRLVERNVGEIDHSHAQSNCNFYLKSRYAQRYWSGVEVRVQVKTDRFRVPGVSVVKGGKPGRVISSPPALVIEVLSPEDRMSDMQERIDDYLEFGIPFVWVVNPATRRGYIYTREGSREAKDGIMRAGELEVPLSAIFEDLASQ